MVENLIVYMPMDRRQALATGQTLPDKTRGSALFADISGFTPLATTLVDELGPKLGADELTISLNKVFDMLIELVHEWGGSAIAFAGDAITCWFAGDNGQRAAACALVMQEKMEGFSFGPTPAGRTHSFALKVAIAVGPARRMLVGDPKFRVLEGLGGTTLDRLGEAGKLAELGEVVLAPCALDSLSTAVEISALRLDSNGNQYGLVQRLLAAAVPKPWPSITYSDLKAEDVRPWLLPPVYRRLRRGLGEFLAELRPTVALFIRFKGIDYDNDPQAETKLDNFIRWIQTITLQFEGNLVELNIGDKGSYIYINFGAPLAHENDPERAAIAALALQNFPDRIDFLDPLQIGLCHGQVRIGAYGSSQHRTYGALGEAVNLAARLMMAAAPGQILIDQDFQKSILSSFNWQELPDINVKGKSDPVPVFALLGKVPQPLSMLRRVEWTSTLLGRDDELNILVEKINRAKSKQGQMVSVIGEAGIGKSRLVSAAAQEALDRGLLVLVGECESYSMNSGYHVWQPIWQALFELDLRQEPEEIINALQLKLQTIDEKFVSRLPLLGPALNLLIADNADTQPFDAQARKLLLESMLVECLHAMAADKSLMLILEDCHWIDPLSFDLLEAVSKKIEDAPVLVVLTYREMEMSPLRQAQFIDLPGYLGLRLAPLSLDDATAVAAQLFGYSSSRNGDSSHRALVKKLAAQADGNPFYLEELVNFVNDQASGQRIDSTYPPLQLPASLESLVLSRVDRLDEGQQTLLRVASVIGRTFQVSWLPHIYPILGDEILIQQALAGLGRQNLTIQDTTAPVPTHHFRHAVVQSAIYDSLLHHVRASLHEQIGRYIETTFPEESDKYLDLLAFHYEHGLDTSKKRTYLLKAGKAAERAFANESALNHYRRLRPLLERREQIPFLLKMGDIEQLVGRWPEAITAYREAMQIAEKVDDRAGRAWSQTALGKLLLQQGFAKEATAWLEQARASFTAIENQQGLAEVLHYMGLVAVQGGDYETAREYFQGSMVIRLKIGDKAGESLLLSHMGMLAEYDGDYMLAQNRHKKALSIRQALNDRRNIADSLNSLGHLSLLLGDPENGYSQTQEAVTLHRDTGDHWALGTALNYSGNAALALNRIEQAKANYLESLDLFESAGARWSIAALLEDIALLAYRIDKPVEALKLFTAVTSLRQDIEAPMPYVSAADVAELIQHLYEQLGEMEAFAVTAVGRSLDLQQAIALARSALS